MSTTAVTDIFDVIYPIFTVPCAIGTGFMYVYFRPSLSLYYHVTSRLRVK